MLCISGIHSQQVLTVSGGKATGNPGTKSVESIKVGDMHGGGVVAWVNKSGTHGLILSAIDLSTSQEWSNNNLTEVGSSARWWYDGRANSEAIIAQPGHMYSAAQLCIDYVNEDYGTGVFSDWYLPAIHELKSFLPNLMNIHFALINDNDPFTIPPYGSLWSSTEDGVITAKFLSLSVDNPPNNVTQKSRPHGVRAVRAF